MRPASTEDKLAWCASGERQEFDFVSSRLPLFQGLRGDINPDKSADKYAHDLTVAFQTDLKSQTTPFFKARELYGLDPQYTVSFNDKDGLRYSRKYPNLIVIFDVNWTTVAREIEGVAYAVEPMHRTYAGFLTDVRRAIAASGFKQVIYQKRIGDESGNATMSWLLDVRHLHLIKEH